MPPSQYIQRMNARNYVRVLTINFDGEIKPFEIPLFRGCVIDAMRGSADILYHNHTEDDGFRYSYPLIQYKRIRGKAAIVCVNQGADIIGQYFAEDVHHFSIGNREMDMNVEKITPQKVLVQVWDDIFKYRIRKWLALNPDNYKKYMENESIVERTTLLESILKGNLLSFAKGLGINIDKEIELHITGQEEPYTIQSKGVKLMAFDVEFKTNMSIPEFIGLGKNASLGYGIVTIIIDKKNENNN